MSPSSVEKKCANPLILGSGICGLAIAHHLSKNDSDLPITMIEKEDRPGGLARTITLGGQVADMGPHRIHTELPDVQDFLADFIGAEMEHVKRKSAMYLNGSWIDYPPKPFEILRVLGPIALMKVGVSFGIELITKLFSSGKKDDHFEQVMTDAFGSELYRLIVLDYTKKVWKISPKKIHGDIARVRVSAGGLQQMIKRVFVKEKKGQETSLSQFYYLPGGVETLIKKFTSEVTKKKTTIHLSETISDVKPLENGQWEVRSVDQNGTEITRQSDQVYSTIPVTELCTYLLKYRPNDRVQQCLDDCRFIANFLVMLVIDQDRVSDNQWLYFPGKETIFNRGYEPKNFSSTMGENGQTLMILEITCYEGDEIWNAPDKKLIRQTVKDLDKIGFLKSNQIVDQDVVRIPYTYPLYDLEYRERTQMIWDYLKQFPGLISVGRQGLFLHNNMDHSIHMGFQAAELVQKKGPAKAPESWYDHVERFQQFRIVD